MLKALRAAGCDYKTLHRLGRALLRHPMLVLDAAPAKRESVIRWLHQHDSEGTFRVAHGSGAPANTTGGNDRSADMSGTTTATGVAMSGTMHNAHAHAAPSHGHALPKSIAACSHGPAPLARICRKLAGAGPPPGPMAARPMTVAGGAAIGAGMGLTQEIVDQIQTGSIDQSKLLMETGVAAAIGAQITAVLASQSLGEAGLIGLVGGFFMATLDSNPKSDLIATTGSAVLEAIGIFMMQNWMDVSGGVAVPVVKWVRECSDVLMRLHAAEIKLADATRLIGKITVTHGCTDAGAALAMQASLQLARVVPSPPLKVLVVVGGLFVGALFGRSMGAAIVGDVERPSPEQPQPFPSFISHGVGWLLSFFRSRTQAHACVYVANRPVRSAADHVHLPYNIAAFFLFLLLSFPPLLCCWLLHLSSIPLRAHPLLLFDFLLPFQLTPPARAAGRRRMRMRSCTSRPSPHAHCAVSYLFHRCG